MSKYKKLFEWFESNNIKCGRKLYRKDIEPNKIYYNYDFADSTYYTPKLLNCEKCLEISFYHGDSYLHENYEVHSVSEFCYIEINFDTNLIACGKYGNVLKFVDFNDLTNKIIFFIYDLSQKENHDESDESDESNESYKENKDKAEYVN